MQIAVSNDKEMFVLLILFVNLKSVAMPYPTKVIKFKVANLKV